MRNLGDAVESGHVTEFDASRGVARIRLEGGELTSLHAAAVYGGRARMLAVGDEVRVQVHRVDSGPPQAISGRLGK